MVRLLVVSGTLGAGKTHTADALRDVLAARGKRVAVLDLDALCQLDPAPGDDPHQDRLAFANLAAVWPNYRARGADHLVVARVVEDLADRERYRAAVPGADVRVVRVVASSVVRRARLTAREPAGHWRDGHLRRTDPLAERLDRLALDDLVVDNEDRDAGDVAREVLARLGW